MQMRVSVVMATYNGARYVEAQLVSILTQDRPPDELIVADDGSTDGTTELVAGVLSRLALPALEVVVLPPGERLGVSGNFERGIRAATGAVIALSDQDDVWHPDRLSAALAALEPSALLQHADAVIVGEDGRPLGFRLFEAIAVGDAERAAVAGGDAFGLYLRRNLATGAATLFRRELSDLALPIASGWVHDEWLAIIAAAYGRIQIFDRPVLDYRQHGQNQIGVARRTLGHRLRRMLAPRDGRYEGFAARMSELERRLVAAEVAESVRSAATSKHEFENARASYPAVRIARVIPVLRQFVRGRYERYSSQRRVDVLRDLLQRSSDQAAGARPRKLNSL
jgi:glycosyltransferase involved in cell wall biosynthesis